MLNIFWVCCWSQSQNCNLTLWWYSYAYEQQEEHSIFHCRKNLFMPLKNQPHFWLTLFLHCACRLILCTCLPFLFSCWMAVVRRRSVNFIKSNYPQIWKVFLLASFAGFSGLPSIHNRKNKNYEEFLLNLILFIKNVKQLSLRQVLIPGYGNFVFFLVVFIAAASLY